LFVWARRHRRLRVGFLRFKLGQRGWQYNSRPVELDPYRRDRRKLSRRRGPQWQPRLVGAPRWRYLGGSLHQRRDVLRQPLERVVGGTRPGHDLLSGPKRWRQPRPAQHARRRRPSDVGHDVFSPLPQLAELRSVNRLQSVPAVPGSLGCEHVLARKHYDGRAPHGRRRLRQDAARPRLRLQHPEGCASEVSGWRVAITSRLLRCVRAVGCAKNAIDDAACLAYLAAEKNVASLNRSSWSLWLAFLNLRTRPSSWGETEIPGWSPSKNNCHSSTPKAFAHFSRLGSVGTAVPVSTSVMWKA